MPFLRRLVVACLVLIAAPAVAQPPPPGEDPPTYWYGAASRAVGDLDGDGLADVVHVRAAGEQSMSGVYRYDELIQARRGRDGALLWERQYPEEAWYWVARLANGRRLVVVASNHTTGTSGPDRAGPRTVRMEAVRSDGSTAWSRDPGPYGVVNPLVMADLTVEDVVGVVSRGRGRNDALLAVTSSGTSRFALIDAGTGAVTTLGEAQAPTAWRRVWLPGDVTGDGVDDYLTSGSATPSTSNEYLLTAYDGTDGRQAWTATLPVASSAVGELVPVPSITTDRLTDLVVPADGEVLAVDGRTGRLLWRRDGHTAIALSRRGRSAILALASRADLDHPSSTMTAYDGVGRRLWQARTSIRFTGTGGVDTFAAAGGDINGDGVDDALFATRQDRDGQIVAEDGMWVDGQRGTARRTTLGATPLHRSFDRAGDDTATVTLQRGRLVAAIYDGRTARRLWQLSLPALPGRLDVLGDPVQPVLARLHPGRCPSVLIDTFGDGEDATTYVLDPNTGRLAWALISGETLPRVEHRPATASGGLHC